LPSRLGATALRSTFGLGAGLALLTGSGDTRQLLVFSLDVRHSRHVVSCSRFQLFTRRYLRHQCLESFERSLDTSDAFSSLAVRLFSKPCMLMLGPCI